MTVHIYGTTLLVPYNLILTTDMALASSSSRNPGVPYSADQLREKLVDDAGNNATDLYCPLGGCRCLLLRKGSARLVKRDGEAVSDHTDLIYYLLV